MPASIAVLLAAALALGTATPQSAASTPAPKDETPTQLYLRFRAATQTAKSMDEVTAFWSAGLIGEFNTMPEADKASTLEMIKRLESGITDLKVVGETPTPSGAQLALEGLGPDKKPMAGTVDLVKEQGSWKLVEAEQWRPKSNGAQRTRRA